MFYFCAQLQALPSCSATGGWHEFTQTLAQLCRCTRLHATSSSIKDSKTHPVGHDLRCIQDDPHSSRLGRRDAVFLHFLSSIPNLDAMCVLTYGMWWCAPTLLHGTHWHPVTSPTLCPRFLSKLECCWSCDWHSLTHLPQRPLNLSVPAEVLPTPGRHCWTVGQDRKRFDWWRSQTKK